MLYCTWMLFFLNVWEERLPSDWMQCVVESAPESISVSSVAHLKEQEPEWKHYFIVQPLTSSISINVWSTHTFSCSEEGKCLELDSPPGMLNWGWPPWGFLNKEKSIFLYRMSDIYISTCWIHVVRKTLTRFSLAVTLGALWLAVSLRASAS